MKTQKLILILISLLALQTGIINAQNPDSQNDALPVQMEEMNAIQFLQGVEKSDQTILLPFGVLEKHGPHLPLGTDLINVRELALRAAKQEYTIVFPPYYFAQIFEAKHQPGTLAYSSETIWNLLQETCDELSRNGFKKIIIVNGHGGNTHFLHYFGQVQLEKKRDYAVYLFTPGEDEAAEKKMQALRKTRFDGHAGENESSNMMSHRPDLVQTEIAGSQSGESLERLADLDQAYTGIWWYAEYPNHYAGDGTQVNPELGKIAMDSRAGLLVKMIQSVKKDEMTLKLQEQFFRESANPLKTKQ